MGFLKNLISSVLPPARWRVYVIFLVGVLTGLVVLILHVSRAPSYLSDDPKACINCHVMIPQYANWQKSSHYLHATCNDCHVPQDNVIRKYAFKSMDGLRHSTMFTFRLEPQVIKIKEAGINVVQENCIRCHQNVIHPTSLTEFKEVSSMDEKEGLCWTCHREVPHGRVRSLSATPFAIVPELDPVVPKWIEEYLKNDTTGK